MSAAESDASRIASELLSGLVRRGVRDVVVCPGSRSQALALAAARFERAGLLRLRVRIDERSAGFLALGLAAESGVPVPIIVTSGTAVANLHPAVLEARYAGVPLIVLSADRPARLRGTGANQTAVQPGLFADAVVAEWELDPDAPAGRAAQVASAALDAGGPVHVDVAADDPLSDAFDRPLPEPGSWTPPARTDTQSLDLDPDTTTVVIAGADAGERAEELARELGAPLLAEVSSGARFGPHLVAAYRMLLDDDRFGGRVRRAVVLGHPTLSRQVPQLLGRPDVEVIVVPGAGRDAYAPPGSDPRIVDGVGAAGPPDPGARAWVGPWVAASRALLEREEAPAANTSTDYRERARFARTELERLRTPLSRRDLVEAVWAATWPHDRLLLGASRLIRELDTVAPGKRIRVHANRGLSGIDGTVSTGVGIALASQDPQNADPRSADDRSRTGTTRVLLGDLALLHDVGGMLFPDGEPRPRIQLIVGNDGGGTIFDALEVASADPELFTRVQLTPQSARLEALADAYGWEYRRIADRGDLDQGLTASPGPTLIEVPLDR